MRILSAVFLTLFLLGSTLAQSSIRDTPSTAWDNFYLPEFELPHTAQQHAPSFQQNQITHTLRDSVNLEWMREYGTNTARGDARCADAALDGLGNLYVAGWAEQVTGNSETVLIKYSTNGMQEWISTFNVDSLSGSNARRLILDDLGNIFLIAHTWSSESYTLVKYSPAGDELWTTEIDASIDEDFNVDALAIDSQNNLIIAGDVSEYQVSTNQLVTLKYSTGGTLLWESRYTNEEAPHYIFTSDMALDSLGNVYVSGRIRGADSDWDILTIKYTPDGAEVWSQTFNGTANNKDYPTSMILDHAGNLIVTGQSEFTDGRAMITISYDTQGNQQWISQFGTGEYGAIGRSLAADSSGNVYIGGILTSDSYDHSAIIVKYDSQGNEIWVASEENQDCRSITLDNSGNVIATFQDDPFLSESNTRTVKYSPEGDAMWVNDFTGDQDNASVKLKVSDQGEIYVSGTTISGNATDFTTIKYDTEGSEAWISSFSGPIISRDNFTAMTLDAAGYIYLAGQSPGATGQNDYITYKLDPNGDTCWVARYDGGHSDRPTLIEVDSLGNVIVSGIASGSTGYPVLATVKYNSDGIQMWAQRYHEPAIFPRSLVFDSQGNVLIAGSFNVNGELDGFILKYGSDGIQQWVATYDGEVNGQDQFADIKVTTQGEYVVTGRSSGLDDTYDFVTLKYLSDGTLAWMTRYEEETSVSSGGTVVEIDRENNLILGGYSGNNYVLIKYSPDGEALWADTYEVPDSWLAAVYGIEVDSNNSYVVAAYSFFMSEDSLNMVTLKYSPHGDRLWMHNLSGHSGYFYLWNWPSIKLDQYDNCYIAGFGPNEEAPDQPSFTTWKLSSDGIEEWRVDINAEGYADVYGNHMGVDTSGNVYRAFTHVIDSYFASRISLVKYIQIDSPVAIDNSPLPEQFSLGQNFPNPFNPSTTIRFSISETQKTRLTIHNLKGQEVLQTPSKDHAPGVYEFQWQGTDLNGHPLSAGIYLCRVESGSQFQTIKMVLLK